MEDNKAGQQQGFNNSSLENPHCTLDTSLRLGLPGSPFTMDNNPNNLLLAMNHPGQLNEVEDEHPNSDSVANNQALVVSDFGSLSNNNVNGFGHGVELPPVGLDHPWFINNGNNVDIFRRRHHQYVSCRNMITRRHGWRRRKLSLSNRICRRCGTTSTPMWRRGPEGPQTHCNACGLWYSRMCRNRPGEQAGQ